MATHTLPQKPLPDIQSQQRSMDTPSPPSSCGCDVPESKEEISKDYPSKSELERAANLSVYDANGDSQPFKKLYSDQSKRHLIIFIRHFFCGVCQEYVRTLSKSLPPSLLSSLPIPVNLILISCGDPSRIPTYISTTSCPYPLYTDPSRSLYQTFAFGRTMDLGPRKPDYVQVSLASTIFQGIYQGLSAGTSALKGGDFAQVGGEMIFYKGKLEWFHRMQNTRDHAEVGELERLLGVGLDGRLTGRQRSRTWSNPIKGLARRLSSPRSGGSRSPQRRKTEKIERRGLLEEKE